MGDFGDVNGQRIITARLGIPRRGLWTADVKLVGGSSASTVAGAALLTLGDVSLVGTVKRQDTYGGALYARMVGGFGGWGKTVSPRYYAAGVTLTMVAADAASDCGEFVLVDSSVSQSIGPAYTRPALQGSAILSQLVPLWWVNALGLTNLGPRTAASVSAALQVLEYDGARGRLLVSCDSLSQLTPGAALSSPLLASPVTISYVEHEMAESGIVRSEVLI